MGDEIVMSPIVSQRRWPSQWVSSGQYAVRRAPDNPPTVRRAAKLGAYARAM